jgi:hypothetical protein
VCDGVVVVNVWTDLRCDAFFNRGTDMPIAGARVTLRLANGETRVAITGYDGIATFASVAVTTDQTATVSVVYPGSAPACGNSPSEVTLTPDSFPIFSHRANVDFRASP